MVWFVLKVFNGFDLLSDEVMKRKLLIDGDGIGDDRRITLAMKQFVKWCSMDCDDDPEDRSDHSIK